MTLCTLSWESSVFSSSSCLVRSSLLFPLSSCAFSFTCTRKIHPSSTPVLEPEHLPIKMKHNQEDTDSPSWFAQQSSKKDT